MASEEMMMENNNHLILEPQHLQQIQQQQEANASQTPGIWSQPQQLGPRQQSLQSPFTQQVSCQFSTIFFTEDLPLSDRGGGGRICLPLYRKTLWQTFNQKTMNFRPKVMVYLLTSTAILSYHINLMKIYISKDSPRKQMISF